MSRQVRRRIAKLVQDLEEAPEVVLIFAPWALPRNAPETPEARSIPPTSTGPQEKPRPPDPQPSPREDP